MTIGHILNIYSFWTIHRVNSKTNLKINKLQKLVITIKALCKLKINCKPKNL